VERVREFEKGLTEFMETQGKSVLEAIRDTKEISEDTEAKLKASIEAFKQGWVK